MIQPNGMTQRKVDQLPAKFSKNYPLIAACLLYALHAVILLVWGTHPPGPNLSNAAQIVMGALCILAAYQASRRSAGISRYFWGLTAITFTFFVLAQSLASYDDAFHAPHFIQWTVNVLFFFWLTPLGVALYLDPDFEPKGFDWLLVLDLVQVILFWFVGYFYFFYIPAQSASGVALAHSVWALYFVYTGFLIAAFLIRSLLTKSPLVRSLFGRVAAFLVAACVADYFFYYGPGENLQTGDWYDFVWISSNFLLLLVTATWKPVKAPRAIGQAPVTSHPSLLVQSLPLLYSLLIVVIAAWIGQHRLKLAAAVVLVSFACSGARLLATQVRQQRSHRLLEAVIEGTSDAIFLTDRDGRYLMVNSAAAARLGHKIKDVIGKTSRDFFSAENAAHIVDRDRQAMQIGESHTYEEQFNSGGVARTFLNTHGPYRDAGGKVAGAFAVSRDITERKRMEEKLEVQKQFLEQLIHSAPEAIAIVDPDYTVRQINLEFTRVFGFTADEAIGHSLDALIVPPEKQQESDSLADYTTRPVTSVLETIRRRKNGSLVHVSVLVSPVILGTELDAVYCIYRDISDIKTTEEQLRQSQKMEAIGRLAGGVAHDLNNLLTVITGYSELQLAGLAPTDPRHIQATQIMQATERASTLTRQLLAFSRRQVLQPRVLDLNNVIHSVESLLARLIGEDVQIVFTPSSDLGTVRADPGQIEQVIMNLGINARDAMPKGGKLILQTSNTEIDDAYAKLHVGAVPGPYVLLTVSDTGLGMDEYTLAHIFEPFFTTKALGKGTGLGLSTVYGIVQQSSGQISVYSEPGRGTSFKIYLPRVDEPADYSNAIRRPSQATRGQETILLVEDDPQVRQLTCSLLEGCGYSVLPADRMPDVEKHCREHKGAIHLLLTDMIMPGMTGKDVAAVVNRLRPGIRILYMSGYTDDVIDHHGGLDPNTFFLQKPFTSAALSDKVRQALA
jgi:PAS domain S-box-containing protein